MTVGQFLPEPVNDLQRLGPALVAVAADDVADYEASVILKSSFDFVIEVLEVRHMVQGLIRDDSVVPS